MESVVIVAPKECTLEHLRRRIPTGYAVGDASDGRLIIQSAGRRAYFGVDARVVDDLEPEVAARIKEAVATPVFFVLDYSDIALCKELLATLADRPDVLVDNDHGVVVPGSEFVQRLRREPEWDWCHD